MKRVFLLVFFTLNPILARPNKALHDFFLQAVKNGDTVNIKKLISFIDKDTKREAINIAKATNKNKVLKILDPSANTRKSAKENNSSKILAWIILILSLVFFVVKIVKYIFARKKN